MDKETYIDGDKTILNTEYYLYLLEKENQNISLQQQLEEKDKVIDEILDDGFFEKTPLNQKVYFENKVKVRGKKV